jgi:chromate transporter
MVLPDSRRSSSPPNGWLLHRAGGIAAGALFVLPSLLVLIALSWIYMAYGQTPAVSALLYGVKPAVVAIVVHAAWRIGSRTLRSASLWIVAALAFIAIYAFAAPFPAIIVAAGLIGAVGGRVAPAQFSGARAHVGGSAAHHASVIDDDTRRPTQIPRPRLAIVVAIGVLCGARRWARWRSSSTAQTLARRPVLHQGGAGHLRRRVRGVAVRRAGRGRYVRMAQPAQMIDGLALGERRRDR